MRIKLLLAATSIFLTQCKPNSDPKIHGTWTSIDLVDQTGMDLRDEVIFTEDGEYKMTIYVKGDSVVQQMNGTFELDEEAKKLQIQWNGITIDHELIEIGKDTLKYQTPQGQRMRMLRK